MLLLTCRFNTLNVARSIVFIRNLMEQELHYLVVQVDSEWPAFDEKRGQLAAMESGCSCSQAT